MSYCVQLFIRLLANQLFNWSAFLGDCGAYLVGFLVAWTSIIFVARSTDTSPWALLLFTTYPVLELLITVTRRIYFKQSLMEPDQKHLHHLIHRSFIRRLSLPNQALNSFSSLLILILQTACSTIGLVFQSNSIVCSSLFFLLLSLCFFAFFQRREEAP